MCELAPGQNPGERKRDKVNSESSAAKHTAEKLPAEFYTGIIAADLGGYKSVAAFYDAYFRRNLAE
jgi:hypothetical protein